MIPSVRLKIAVNECNHLILNRQGLIITHLQYHIRVGSDPVCVTIIMGNRDMVVKAGEKCWPEILLDLARSLQYRSVNGYLGSLV